MGLVLAVVVACSTAMHLRRSQPHRHFLNVARGAAARCGRQRNITTVSWGPTAAERRSRAAVSRGPSWSLLARVFLVVGMAGVSLVTTPSPSAMAAGSAPFIRMMGLSYWASTKLPAPSPAFLADRASESADFLGGLGANAALVSFPLFTSGWTSSEVTTGIDPTDPKSRTPTPEEVGILVDALEARGIAVTIRPLLNEGTISPQHWRGSIAPKNRSRWFRSYRTTIGPYLAMAEAHHAHAFDIQSELQNLVGDPHWTTLIAWAHSQFSGTIVWNPDYIRSAPSVIARPHTKLALDLYPGLPLTDSATIGQIVAAWNAWYRSGTAPQTPLQTTIAEVGIPALSGMYASPWKHGCADISSPCTIDQSIQAHWFTAACQFAKQNGFAGISFWTTFHTKLPSLTLPNPDPNQIQPDSLAAIKACFAGSS